MKNLPTILLLALAVFLFTYQAPAVDNDVGKTEKNYKESIEKSFPVSEHQICNPAPDIDIGIAQEQSDHYAEVPLLIGELQKPVKNVASYYRDYDTRLCDRYDMQMHPPNTDKSKSTLTFNYRE